MINLAIEGTTRRVGKSQGYKGVCIADYVLEDGTPAMQTAWQLTPSELDRLNKGAYLYLTIMGTGWPPILLQVGE